VKAKLRVRAEREDQDEGQDDDERRASAHRGEREDGGGARARVSPARARGEDNARSGVRADEEIREENGFLEVLARNWTDFYKNFLYIKKKKKKKEVSIRRTRDSRRTVPRSTSARPPFLLSNA
jgi:hypothetical protein